MTQAPAARSDRRPGDAAARRDRDITDAGLGNAPRPPRRGAPPAPAGSRGRRYLERGAGGAPRRP